MVHSSHTIYENSDLSEMEENVGPCLMGSEMSEVPTDYTMPIWSVLGVEMSLHMLRDIFLRCESLQGLRSNGDLVNMSDSMRQHTASDSKSELFCFSGPVKPMGFC